MSKSDQTVFGNYFSPKNSGIRYIPGLGIIFGVNAGIMLSQLLYWNGKGKKKPWTYKSAVAMFQETGLTRTQQDNAIRILKEHDVIQTKRMSVHATRARRDHSFPVVCPRRGRCGDLRRSSLGVMHAQEKTEHQVRPNLGPGEELSRVVGHSFLRQRVWHLVFFFMRNSMMTFNRPIYEDIGLRFCNAK